ncbi:metallophosphoesterase [Candidatus Saccharibacteria bacterium]|nr:metallophosphoesterase [Candidatus Saccharibacteria bacterium]
MAGDFETTDYGGDDFPTYRDFVRLLSKQLAKHGLTVVFVDGNHDRHSFLRGLMAEQGVKNYDKFVRVRDNIWYAPRGFTWTWSGKQFMALGGAYSVADDRNGQIARGVYEWDEAVSPADMRRAYSRLGGRGTIDVLVTHDCPMEVPLAELHEGVRPWTRGDSPETDANRQLVSQVFVGGGIPLCFHGHYHLAYECAVRGGSIRAEQRVVGLGADAEAGSMHLLDLSQHPVSTYALDIVSA